MRKLVVLLGVVLIATLVAGCGFTGEAKNKGESELIQADPEDYKNEVNFIMEDLKDNLNEQLSQLEKGDHLAASLIESATALSWGDAVAINPPEGYFDLHNQLDDGLEELTKKATLIKRHYEEGNTEYPEELVDDLIEKYHEVSEVRYEIIKKYNSDNPVE